jgi:Sulfotransferase family
VSAVSAEPSPTARPRVSARRVPDFFIVGNPKSGTTALYEMLCRQPRIFMPSVKEPHFFAGESAAASERVPRTLDDYLALFAEAAPGQLLGEASPSYLRSRTAAASIAALQPQARIVAILREPASFLRSMHLQMLQMHVETVEDLGQALALEPTRPQPLLYSERVRYVEQLRRFGDVFRPENVLVLIYDDFRADNEGTVRRVLDFLGVDDAVPVVAREANPTVRLRSKWLDDWIHGVSVGRGPVMKGVRLGIKAVTSRRLRHGALGMRGSVVYGEPRAPDEQLMLELRGRFKGEVEALSDYLGRDLVDLWGYGSVD